MECWSISERRIKMDQTKDILEKQLRVEIEKISVMEDGSEEKSQTIDGINKLYRLMIDQEKNEADVEIEEIKTNTQTWIDRAKLAVDVIAIGAPLVFYGVWMGRGFKFEETGTYTSRTFQGLTKFFKPTKK